MAGTRTITRPASGSVPTLRTAAGFFAVAVLVHNGDHLRRGGDSVSADVFWLGSAALLVEVGVVALVFTRHRLAPLVATIAGFQLALGYLAVHFTPARGWFSDSFLNTGASPVSITAAALEAIAAAVLGVAAVAALRSARGSRHFDPAGLRHPLVVAMAVGNVLIFVGSLATR